MNGRHLRDDELDRLLAGLDVDREAEAHLGECLLCRRRRAHFLAAVAATREELPSEAVLAVLRQQALAVWGQPRRHRQRWWFAAAAVLFLVLLLPATRTRQAFRQVVDVEVVLEEVDAVLARDPLAALAPSELLDTLLPEGAGRTKGGVS